MGCKTYDIKPVDIRLRDPALELVGHVLRRADDRCAEAADADVLRDGVLGPLRDAGQRLGPALDGGSGASQHTHRTQWGLGGGT